MQAISSYRFMLELFADGDRLRALRQVAIEPDQWSPALEWARFAAARNDAGTLPIMSAGPGVIDPLWCPTLGEPYVVGFRVTVPTGSTMATSQFAADYFDDLAQHFAQLLKASGDLPEGESCRYLVYAFAAEESPQSDVQPTSSWQVTPLAQKLVVERFAVADLLSASEPCGPLADDDLPVFIPRSVLDEVVALHEQAGAAETGGNLIGHLHRDPEQPEKFFIRVTAQLPARHAQQELTKLTFTPASWAEVDGAIRLRGAKERKLGWWHTHPARRWCEQCSAESRARCKLSGEFFSAHDAALHRATYPMAFGIALVVSDSYQDGLTFPIFGWHSGRLVRRGFHILHAAGAAAGSSALPGYDTAEL